MPLLNQQEENVCRNYVDKSKNRFQNPFNSTDQNEGFANSVGPSHQELHCLLFSYFVTTLFANLFSIFVYVVSLIEIMDTFNFIDGPIHLRNSGMTGLMSGKQCRP